MGYNLLDVLHDNFSENMREVIDSGDGGAPGPNNGMAVGILLVLSFRYIKGPKVEVGRL